MGNTLNDTEKKTLEALANAWNLFLKIDNISDDDREAFRFHINDLARIVAFQSALRTNPGVLI